MGKVGKKLIVLFVLPVFFLVGCIEERGTAQLGNLAKLMRKWKFMR